MVCTYCSQEIDESKKDFKLLDGGEVIHLDCLERIQNAKTVVLNRVNDKGEVEEIDV